MTKYRCVILGCGPRAYGHADAYKYVDQGELVACCDLDKDRLDKFSQAYQIKGYSDFKSMLEKENPDLVHLVTPPSHRVSLMTMVDQHQIPACLVEKPIACEVRDWKQLCDLETKSKTRFAVGQQVRFQDYLGKCHSALESGRLGKLDFIDFSAGMNISAQGTHIIDWAMFLNNDTPVASVFGAASGLNSLDPDEMAHPAPDMTVAQIIFKNGVYGLWNNGGTARRVSSDREIWKHLRIAAYAEKGHVLFEEFGKWGIYGAGEPEEGRTSMANWTMTNDQALAGLIQAMFNWIEDPAAPPGTCLSRALHQWNVVLGLYASALWRKPVDIPFNPPDDLFDHLAEALTLS